MNTLHELGQPAEATGRQEEAHELVRYWRAIKRNRLGIALFVIAVGILASVYAFSLRPVYRGTATVLLDPVRKKTITNEEMYETFAGTARDYYLTQIELMKSREFAERLVRVLNLTRHRDYDPRQPKAGGWGGYVHDWYQSARKALLGDASRDAALPVPGTAPGEEDIRDGAVARIMGQVSIQAVRNTQLVNVVFDSYDPVLAERVPNTLSMIYIVSDLEARTAASRQSMSFISAQADELKKKLADSERELQQYRESQKIVMARGLSLSEATQRLDEISSNLEDARRKRAEAESLYRQANIVALGKSTDAMEALAVLQRNPVLLRMRETELEAERRVGEFSKRYGPEHPRMVSAQADLRAAQDSVRRQTAAVVQAVTKEYEIAKANEAQVEQAYSRAKSDAQVFNRAEFPLARLERDVESNRRLYEAFMQRTKELRIGDIQQPIARIVDPALTPKAPSGPNVRQIVGLAMVAALLFAVAIALFLERLDNKIRTSDEMESRLAVKAVGVLPRMRTAPELPLDRIFIDDNANTFSEAIRTIRSDVQLSGLDSPQKVVLVTSTMPDEGKTTVACNLAFAFSQVKKTLYIEADMRKPKVARLFGFEPNTAGLSEFVSGNIAIEQCVRPVDNTRLHVLPTGRVPLNPLEMLASERFAEAIDSLKRSYEVIIMDSPPVQLVSDALVLSGFATAVLFVVKADDTPYPLVRNSITRMLRINAPVLGAVLNHFDVEKAQKYYSDYSGLGAAYYGKYGYLMRSYGSGKKPLSPSISGGSAALYDPIETAATKGTRREL